MPHLSLAAGSTLAAKEQSENKWEFPLIASPIYTVSFDRQPWAYAVCDYSRAYA